jgi:ribosomal protein S12 methylthiotransferase accessory factor
VLERLGAAGFTRVAAVELDSPVSDLHVRRVVVPGMHISELL